MSGMTLRRSAGQPDAEVNGLPRYKTEGYAMIEVLSDDAVATVSGGDGEGLDYISDTVEWFKRLFKDPRTDGTSPNDVGVG